MELAAAREELETQAQQADSELQELRCLLLESGKVSGSNEVFGL